MTRLASCRNTELIARSNLDEVSQRGVRWTAWLSAVLLGGAVLAGCAGNGSAPLERTDLADADRRSNPNRERAKIRLELATTYFQNGQYDVALDETGSALDIDGTLSEAYSLRGLIYSKQGEQAKAEASFRRALQMRPSDADARHNLAVMYCQNNQLAAAVQEFNQAVAMARVRERSKTLLAMGICQARLGDRAGAEASLMRAFQDDPTNPMVSFNLATLQYQRGAYAESLTAIRPLNNSQLANAESMWLGVRAARKAGDGRVMRDLSEQLRRRFSSSSEYQKLERGAFDD